MTELVEVSRRIHSVGAVRGQQALAQSARRYAAIDAPGLGEQVVAGAAR